MDEFASRFDNRIDAKGRVSLPAQGAILLAVFALVTGVAELAGAANLGTAMGIGQIAFMAVLIALLLRR